MLLVVDTNVFLLKDDPMLFWFMAEISKTLSKSAPKFFFCLDNEQTIDQEYFKKAKETGLHLEDPIQQILKIVMDGNVSFICRSSHNRSERLADCLEKLGCKPIEPELWGVAEQNSQTGFFVRPRGSHFPIPRLYADAATLQQIQGASNVQIRTLSEVQKDMDVPKEYSPETIEELQKIISTKEERTFMEFKCPESDYLTQHLLHDTVRAVCGFLNTHAGWVFLGVSDNGEIRPFSPRYGNPDKPLSMDNLLRDIRGEVDRISPNPGLLVNAWPIRDENTQKCVVAIHVQQGDQDYLYRDKKEKSKGVKLIRTGYQTQIDSNWAGNSVHIK